MDTSLDKCINVVDNVECACYIYIAIILEIKKKCYMHSENI